jgi:hypothetical protein
MSKGTLGRRLFGAFSAALLLSLVGACGVEKEDDAESAFIWTPPPSASVPNMKSALASDVRAKVGAITPTEGLSLVENAGGMSLYARYKGGHLDSYEIRGSKGEIIPSKVQQNATPAGDCMQCGVEKSDTQCWVLPCPKTAAPLVQRQRRID